jgi:hypothetical protein
MEVSGQLHALAALPPKERAPGTHWIGGLVGPRAVLDAVVKKEIPSPRQESNPRTPIVQPAAQSYTAWAITDLEIYKAYILLERHHYYILKDETGNKGTPHPCYILQLLNTETRLGSLLSSLRLLEVLFSPSHLISK